MTDIEIKKANNILKEVAELKSEVLKIARRLGDFWEIEQKGTKIPKKEFNKELEKLNYIFFKIDRKFEE